MLCSPICELGTISCLMKSFALLLNAQRCLTIAAALQFSLRVLSTGVELNESYEKRERSKCMLVA